MQVGQFTINAPNIIKAHHKTVLAFVAMNCVCCIPTAKSPEPTTHMLIEISHFGDACAGSW